MARRGQRRELRLRSGPNPRLRADRRAVEQARRQFEATKQPTRVFATCGIRPWTVESRAAGRGQGRAFGEGSQPPVRGPIVCLEDIRPRSSMKRLTAVVARWKTGSRSNSFTCSRIGQVPRRCGPIRSACSARRSPTPCWRHCGGWLTETSMAQAQCQTIRLRLLKIGALVQVTVRQSLGAIGQQLPLR